MAQVEKCSGCKGDGYIFCPVCNGTGNISKKGNFLGDFGLGEKVECQACQGSGKLVCKMCGGVGKLSIDKPKTGWI